MSRMPHWMTSLLVLTISATGWAESPQTSPVGEKSRKAQAQHALDDMIARLDEGDIGYFIEYYIPADEYIRMLKAEQDIDVIVREIKAEPQITQQLSKGLKVFQEGELTLNENETIATFKVKITEETPGVNRPKSGLEPMELPKNPKGFGGELQPALKAALTALGKKDYLAFIVGIFPLEQLQAMAASGELSALLAQLQAADDSDEESSAPGILMLQQMQNDLRALQKVNPTFTEEGIAVFTLPGPVFTKGSGPRANEIQLPDRIIKFEKVQGNWRFVDEEKEAREQLAELDKLQPKETYTSLQLVRFGDNWRILEFPR